MTEHPNLVFIVMDATRADHLSCYGYSRETSPYLSELCTDAVKFTNAFAASAWTAPSHASMFTGKYPSEHGYTDSMMDLEGHTLAEKLSQEDFDTRSVVWSPNLGKREELSRGFDRCYDIYRIPHYPDSLTELKQYYTSTYKSFIKELFKRSFERTDWVSSPSLEQEEFQTSIVREYIRDLSGSESPFFLFTNFLDAHSPYKPDDSYFEIASFETFDCADIDYERLQEIDVAERFRYMAGEVDISEEMWDCLRDWYDVQISGLDYQIERIVTELKNIGEYSNTMIVVTADHGEHFGEHGLAEHHFGLYDELIQVPLLIKFPEQRYAGRTVTELTSHIDLYPTICDVLEIESTTSSGNSLVPFDEYERDYVFAEYGRNVTSMSSVEQHTTNRIPDSVRKNLFTDFQCVRSDTEKYIRRRGVTDEFYDLQSDPNESEDRLGDLDEGTATEFKQILSETLDELPEFEAIADVHPEEYAELARRARNTDEAATDKLRELGYL